MSPFFRRRVFYNKKRPTQRALDAGDSAAFSDIFWLRVFPAPKHCPRPPQRQPLGVFCVIKSKGAISMSNKDSISNVEQEIIELEQQWASAIQKQDPSQMNQFLSESYFLAIGAQDQPLQIVPRAAWLGTLKEYRTESFRVDDIKVHIYGTVAIVLMLFTQTATVRGQDRSGQFMITDIWNKQEVGWRVVERHSSRPEPQAIARP
jgi:ketosteroid isomerase-like protein